MKRYAHAPDGAMIPGSLCEREGDTVTRREDVDCPECLDVLDVQDQDSYNWPALVRSTNELRSGR